MTSRASQSTRPRRSEKREARVRRTASGAAGEDRRALRFTKVNAIFAGSGLLTLALGYWLLGEGSITAAPLLLVLAYVVLLPLAIIR